MHKMLLRQDVPSVEACFMLSVCAGAAACTGGEYRTIRSGLPLNRPGWDEACKDKLTLTHLKTLETVRAMY
jgi:hypothetical protein